MFGYDYDWSDMLNAYKTAFEAGVKSVDVEGGVLKHCHKVQTQTFEEWFEKRNKKIERFEGEDK